MRKTETKNRIHDTRVGTFSEKSEENLSEIAKNAAAHTHRGYLSCLFALLLLPYYCRLELTAFKLRVAVEALCTKRLKQKASGIENRATSNLIINLLDALEP